jgi:oligopeptide transport system substrate-binding protein
MPFLKMVSASLLLSLLVVACSQGESNTTSGNRQGILHLGNGTDPQELDPHIVTDPNQQHPVNRCLLL